jgi:hypothetical protein
MRTNDVRVARAALELDLLAYEFMSGGNLRLCFWDVNVVEQLPVHGTMLGGSRCRFVEAARDY